MDDSEPEVANVQLGIAPIMDAPKYPAGPVLVVSGAQITGVVVCKIVERVGLKCVTVNSAEMEDAFVRYQPAAVIIDEDHDSVVRVTRIRSVTSGPRNFVQRPAIILLATDGPALQAGQGSPHVDAVVSKPVRPDHLQPLLFDMLVKGRN